MKKMCIAHIMGKWNGGGVESLVMNYYSHIDRKRFQFDFICDSDSTNIPYDEIKKLGGNVIIIPPYQKLFKYNKELFKLFKNNNYLIVHSHINTLSIFPLRIAKKAGVPIRICHSHSTSNKKELLRSILKYILRPFSKIYATDYFACSKYSGEWLFGKKNIKNNQVFILNNAIDTNKFKYNVDKRIQLRNKFNIDDNTLVIGHVGRFVKQKNHLFLIEVFNEILKKRKDAVLFLIGNGPLVDEVNSLIEKLNIKENVFILDYRKDVNDFYSMFDIFLLPSLYEGLPLVGVEAQCAGLFCSFSSIITDELKVNDNVQFISLNNKSCEWADIILENYDKIDRKKAYQSVSKSNFNIEVEALRLESKYLLLLEKYDEKESNSARC